MRIWFAAAQTKDTFGGVYRSVTALAEALARQGHQVSTLWSRREGKRVQLFFSLYLFARLVCLFWRRPDWIIARSSDGLLCALAARFRLVNVRVALHSHGWEEKVFEVERRLPRAAVLHPTTWRARLIRFRLLRATLENADRCICGTIEEARFIAARYPRQAGKIKVVPNGVDRSSPRPFWPMQEEWPPSFLIVGGFTWKKNVDYGIELFKKVLGTIPDARLFCVGAGPLRPATQSLVESAGDAVFIVERELPHKMFLWYETCPFLIAASRYEGGRSLAILEAQNRGMVAFATAIPSTREFIRDGKTGILLDGCDAGADGARILKICADLELCKSIGAAAWKSASRQAWERQGRRLARVLR